MQKPVVYKGHFKVLRSDVVSLVQGFPSLEFVTDKHLQDHLVITDLETCIMV